MSGTPNKLEKKLWNTPIATIKRAALKKNLGIIFVDKNKRKGVKNRNAM